AELTMGEVVTLSFSLPKARETWEMRAVIRHRRGYHYGFEFLSPSAEQTHAVTSYLRELDRADSDESDPTTK
ncbi:MAG: PilZ domain-containing protein, partial [Candidatus Sulfotelmatobacter sp.]